MLISLSGLWFVLPQVLPVLYPSLRSVISMLTFSQLIVILKNLTSVGETLEGPGCLLQTCQNKVQLWV